MPPQSKTGFYHVALAPGGKRYRAQVLFKPEERQQLPPTLRKGSVSGGYYATALEAARAADKWVLRACAATSAFTRLGPARPHPVPPCLLRRVLHKLGRETSNGLLSEQERAAVDAMSWDELVAGFRALDNSARGNCFSKGNSVYRGVSWSKQAGKWRVKCWHGGKAVCLGHYDDEVAAARAYDQAAFHIHGRSVC